MVSDWLSGAWRASRRYNNLAPRLGISPRQVAPGSRFEKSDLTRPVPCPTGTHGSPLERAMSDISQAQTPMAFRPKYVVFAVIAAMMAYVLYHNEMFLVMPDHPIWQHYAPFKWWLLTHGVAGGLALILVPLQFSDRLRARYAKVHRVIGRIYVVCAL